MFAYVMSERRGETDAVLCAAAERLAASGVALAGAVQINRDLPGQAKCAMELHLLPSGDVVPISQQLGAMARGCRLNPDGLERAVAKVEAALTCADVLIVNKFGKQELSGRGFRDVIAAAVLRDMPVIVGVNPANLAGFEAFFGTGAEALPADPEALLRWAVGHRA